jgi:hypothetical protein
MEYSRLTTFASPKKTCSDLPFCVLFFVFVKTKLILKSYSRRKEAGTNWRDCKYSPVLTINIDLVPHTGNISGFVTGGWSRFSRQWLCGLLSNGV